MSKQMNEQKQAKQQVEGQHNKMVVRINGCWPQGCISAAGCLLGKVQWGQGRLVAVQ